eukprot:scaffold185570_cov20-Tisochrysis_lutea.AAC.1
MNTVRPGEALGEKEAIMGNKAVDLVRNTALEQCEPTSEGSLLEGAVNGYAKKVHGKAKCSDDLCAGEALI